MADIDDVLDARQAARYLKIKEQTIRRLARNSELPSFKVGGVWRFKKSFLDRWAEDQQGYRRRRRVLVVDDDQDVRDVVTEALEAAGFKAAAAAGGPEALRLITMDMPDLVILDLKMAKMDGPTLLKQIRAKWGNIPVVVLTGFPESDLMNRALQFSPLTLLSKPFTPAQIVETVRMTLGVEERGGR